MAVKLGRTLLIVNPAAQNGNGSIVAIEALAEFDKRFEPPVEVVRTMAPGHGKTLAAEAADYDTVIALGGDGLVHEVINGLMMVSQDKRPTFGVIPVGSGNDFARTLGFTSNWHRSLDALSKAQKKTIDIGICNGEYFAETVSFGLDAAIAIETMERRKRTGRKGTILYLSSGLDQLINHLDAYPYELSTREEGTQLGEMYLFAIQNGPTYGGGFAICPDADPADGMLNLCIVHPPLGRIKATTIFLMAKNGHHRGFKAVQTEEASELTVEFDREVPAQIDGEVLAGKRFEITLLPKQLNVWDAQLH